MTWTAAEGGVVFGVADEAMQCCIDLLRDNGDHGPTCG
jgi:hypothetical protein